MTNISPEAAEANFSVAVDFLATIAGAGRTAVAYIIPDGALGGAIFDTTAQRGELAAWLARYNGLANLYFTLNEPTPGAEGRLKESDVETIRGIAVDIDPDRGREGEPGGLELERARLGKLAEEWHRHFFAPPTAIVDSGGGMQMIWLLREPLPNTYDNRVAVKAHARALGRELGSDAVQSVDHLFRVPLTENLPDAKKRARGRKQTQARLLHLNPAARTSLETLAMIAAPVFEPTRATAEMADFDYAAVLEVAEDPAGLPSHLVATLATMRQSSPALTSALANSDRSKRDFALAALAVEAGITDPTEIGQLAFSLSPDRLLKEEGESGRGEWYAARTVRTALERTKPLPTAEDWFADKPAAGPPAPVAGLRVVRGLVNAKALPVRRHLIDPRLPIGDVTQGVGEPGISKSTFGLRDALVVATGREDILRGVDTAGASITAERLHRSGPVLVYNAEDRIDEMERRLAAAQREYGLTSVDMRHDIVLWSGVDATTLKIMERTAERGPLRRSAGADLLERTIREHGAVLVILDPQISLASGASENSNEDQDAIMQELATMASRLAISIEVFHHTGKQMRAAAGDMGAGRGGFAAVAKVRSAFTLTYVTGSGPGEEAWGTTRADRWMRLDYSKTSHSRILPEPIVFRRISAQVGNGTGVAPTAAGDQFYAHPLEQLEAEGDTAPVLRLIDVKGRIAATQSQAAARASASAVSIARLVDAILCEVDETPLSEVWELLRDRMRDESLTKATSRNTVVPAITTALEAGVAIEKAGQTVCIKAVRRGGGSTAPWLLRRICMSSDSEAA